jgi:hypothetical protein
MPSAGQIVDNITAQLHGWGATQDRVTSLAAPVGLTDTSITVTAAFGQSVGISPGMVEIDTEQLYVTTVDQNTGVCSLDPGFGRGYHRTTVATHVSGASVVSRPKFPRKNIFDTMNEVIGAVFPDLFVPNIYTTSVLFPQNTYTIPGGLRTIDILDCQWQDPIGRWTRVGSYSVDPYDATVRLGSVPGLAIGRPLRFVYATEPQLFSSESDDFVTVTGLPPSTQDVIALGATAKMVVGLDISRAQLSSVEQSDRSRVVPPNAGINVGKYLMAEYKDRLANEAQSLRRLYKPRLSRRF